jgi:hypothetical protein
MGRSGFWAVLTAALALAGCGGEFASDYSRGIDPQVSRGWHVTDVRAFVHDNRTVSDDNVLVPLADIVWHGEPAGDRKAQVAAIVADGMRVAAAPLAEGRPVEIHIAVDRFHGVSPVAVARSPAAVHDVAFRVAVVDRGTREVLVPPVRITAALPAYTQTNARLSRLQGETERQRIVDHVAEVMAGWLGTGPDARRTFVSLGY